MIRDWFRFAQEDLIAAQALLEMNNKNTWRASAFHSQQAAEKAIKGYLAYHKISFTKIHDLGLLAYKVEQLHSELKELLQSAVDLVPYAVQFRYPDAATRELDEPEITEALVIAKKIVKKMSEMIPFETGFDF